LSFVVIAPGLDIRASGKKKPGNLRCRVIKSAVKRRGEILGYT